MLSSGYRKRGLLIVICLITAVLPQAWAQNTGKLTGVVSDAETGEPLPGANVLLVDTVIGDATSSEGEYTLLGVPVGTYTLQVSYVGYQTRRVEGVAISAGYTTLVNLDLVPGIALDDVTVQYERPLIQQDAIGIPRVVTAQELVSLPVRGVNSVAAIQPGVVAIEGRDELYVRGGRNQEVAYFVDGVKVIADRSFGFGEIGVPQAAIQEQEMLIGNISARYGDAMSGVINVTTKDGGADFFGSMEALTSRGLDPYGTSLFSGSLGGPLLRNTLSFFVAAEFSDAHDGNPRAVNHLRVESSAYDRLVQSPQVLSATTADGSTVFVELPGNMASGASLPVDDTGVVIVQDDGTVVASDGTVLTLPPGAQLSAVPSPRSGWDVLDPDAFSLEPDRLGNHTTRLNSTATLTFKPSSAFRLRLGGRFVTSSTESTTQWRVLFGSERPFELEEEYAQAYLTLTHYVADNTFYQLQVDASQRQGWFYDGSFSRGIENLLFYGDLDHPHNGTLARFKQLAYVTETRVNASGDTLQVEVPTFRNGFTDGQAFGSSNVAPPGGFNTPYTTFHHRQWRFSGTVTTQLGVHLLEAGVEFEQRTRRRWTLSAGSAHSLAGWFDDSDSCSHGTCGAELAQDIDGDGVRDAVSSYAELPPQILGVAAYYGYDYRGLERVEEQDLIGLLDGTSYDIKPWQPIYYGGYLQDKVEFRDIVLNLGVRVDVFDNNTLVYRDPFARIPIVRADAVADRPSGIVADHAVYFNGDTVVGYRNTDGDFFSTDGEQVAASEVLLQGTPRRLDLSSDEAFRREAWEAVFEDYTPQVSVMPRVGVSYPITTRALFFGRYGITSQRPSTFNFAPLNRLLNPGNTFIPNADLKPEQTVEYEIGFRHRLSERAAFTVSGFFRQIKNLITLRNVTGAFPELYTTAQNKDFGTVKGVELNLDVRRVRYLSLTTNYTLSLAEGTGSDVFANQRTVITGNEPVPTIFPLDFDQRHRLNLSLDVRFGEDQGPRVGSVHPLERVGLNVLVQAASGFPYTAIRLEDANDFFRAPLGAVNANRMPASTRLDLRLDRSLALGPETSLSIFLWVQNVLGAANIFGVYSATGLPDEDGVRLTPAGQADLASHRRPETANLIYDHLIRNQDHYGIPRLMRLGARMTF